MKASISKTGHVTLVYPKAEVPALRQIFLHAEELTQGKAAWTDVHSLAVASYTVVADLAPEVEVPPEFFTKKQIAAGEGHLCVLGCGRRLRTLGRALTHGNLADKNGGHTPAEGWTA